ncbi:MAG: helix-turn-helix transcriptional regulator [Pseudomonadota bacterium]
MTEKKQPHPIDVHVGGRVRLQRTIKNMSQDKLGEALGLTFQQIQKYEKGVNRIGASRLYEICRVLGVNVQFFFDDFDDERGTTYGFAEGNGGAPDESGAPMIDFLNSSEGSQLFKHFSAIKDQKVKKRVIDLVKTIAEGEHTSAS